MHLLHLRTTGAPGLSEPLGEAIRIDARIIAWPVRSGIETCSLRHDAVVLSFTSGSRSRALEATSRVRTDTPLPLVVRLERAAPDIVVDHLNAGADACIAADTNIALLQATVNAVRRRVSCLPEPNEINFGSISICPLTCTVRVSGREVALQPLQYRLLLLLMQQSGRIVTLGEIERHLFDQTTCTTGSSLRNQVARLRRRLGAAGTLVTTMRGVGHGLFPTEQSSP